MRYFHVTTTRSSGEEVDLIVTGEVEGESFGLIWEPHDNHVAARLMSMTFSIESGVKVWLAWEHEGSEDRVILPLEGRGFLDFSKLGGLSNPREAGWSGAIKLRASCPTSGHFTIALELSKQRN